MCTAAVILGPFVVIMRKLGASRHVAVTGRIDLVRAKARTEAAERAVSAANARQMHAARLAENAVIVTQEALSFARQIDKVSGQMDALIDYVTDDRGRHVMPGDYDLEREFLQ